MENKGSVRVRIPPSHNFQQIKWICHLSNVTFSDSTEQTKCDVSRVHCGSVTDQIRFEITLQSLQHVTGGDGDLGQEG